MAPPPKSIPLTPYIPPAAPEVEACAFYERMKLRRSVRFFSSRPVSEETIRWCIAAAGTAPSGANKQPWRFVAVSNPHVKRKIREAAEVEEREFYQRRATPQWLADLAPLGTDADKEFLEVAPWLIVAFKLMKTDPDPPLPNLSREREEPPHPSPPLPNLSREREEPSQPIPPLPSLSREREDLTQPTGPLPDLSREREEPDSSATAPRQGKVYYVDESVGIACGMLISAIHHAGLVTLTHTPSPMGFLAKVLRRPEHERAFLLLPVGYPAPDCPVPDIHRKPIDQIAVWER